VSELDSKSSNWTLEDLGQTLFKYRDYTPIALLLLLFWSCRPTVGFATLGMLFLLFGEMIRMVSVGFIGPVSRTRSDSTGAALMTRGTYGMVRNPLYVGNFFITFGFAVFGGQAWFIVLAVVLFAFQYWAIVSYEESLLEERFGDVFRQYKETVPAWIPKSLHTPVDWTFQRTIPEILASEKRSLTAIAVVIAILVMRS
jgi:protein-S-isoprenylcysteine O-methyltransferase Ste14